MAKFMKTFFIANLVAILFAGTSYGLTIQSVQTLDSLNSARTTFSSSERITLAIEVNNTVAMDRVNFTFEIKNAVGSRVFYHTGNSIPGSIGTGGSRVSSLLISQFYDSPGNFTLTVTASGSDGSSVSDSATFAVYSPTIVLSYPSNGAIDLIDSPLVFRWIGSGASKYKIYVDDDQSFYNTMLAEEVLDTSYSYPQNPSDTRQKLVSGQIYYWKVEGLDAYNNVIAETSVPFSFTVKQEGTTSTRDVAIVSISLGLSAIPPQVPIDVEVKNSGGISESQIKVSLFMAGLKVGEETITNINSGETKVLNFTAEPPTLVPGQPIYVSVSHDLFDDNVQNNLLTAKIMLPDGYFSDKVAKILGRVTSADKNTGEKKGVVGAKVSYSGLKSGDVYTGEGGQYKIDDLPLGTYTLSASHPDHKSSDKKEVILEESKAYTNIDFSLVRKESKEYTLDEIWALLQEYLSMNILKELEGYRIKEIRGEKDKVIFDLMDQLKAGKAKITEASVE